jgi:hypothetical protein|tara:strand:+ start:452 stop:883 length:432 start_codon:yes stop_codon:yes gene_type:complete
MFENEGIELSGSLLASWVGKSTKLLERVSDAIRDHVFAAQAIFMDDTTVKLLQKGKSHSVKPTNGCKCTSRQHEVTCFYQSNPRIRWSVDHLRKSTFFWSNPACTDRCQQVLPVDVSNKVQLSWISRVRFCRYKSQWANKNRK